jgi:predicted transcriptional regulator
MTRKTAKEKVLFRLEKGIDDPVRIAKESGCSRQYVDRIAKVGGYSLKNRLTGAAEMRELIQKLLTKGTTSPLAIQEKLGTTKRRVGYHLKVLKAVRPQAKISKKVATRRERALKLRLKGVAVVEIAETLNVSPQIVTNGLRGHRTVRSMEMVAERRKKILALHAQGRSTASIVDKLKAVTGIEMHPNTIRKVIRLSKTNPIKSKSAKGK